MYSDHLVLQGKTGVKWLERRGPYAVIVNRRLYEEGKAGKYAVVNVEKHWVYGVYVSRTHAASRVLQPLAL